MSYADKEFIIADWYKKYYPLLINMSFKMLEATPALVSLAEDAVQDVFIRACEKYERLKDHPNIAGWLVETCKYRLMHLIGNHQQNANRTGPSLDDDDGGGSAHLSVQDTAEEWVEKKMLAQLQIELFKRLSAKERALYYQAFIMGYSSREIQEFGGLTENAIRSTLKRIREKARETKKYFQKTAPF